MATKYTAFIWPPLIFPLAAFTGKGGFTFTLGARPPMALPTVLASRTSKVATAAAPTMPSMVAPAATTNKVTFTPAAVAVASQNPAKVVNPYTTRAAINTFFGIISPQPGSGT